MAGIYIHIPFCKNKCSYCDFHFSTTFSPYRSEMIDAICREIELRMSSKEFEGEIKTLYFGGGTPSLLLPNEWAQIIKTLKIYVDLESLLEFTIEANPDDIQIDNLELWKLMGVNRLSIGVQSFNDDDLKWMNRAHKAQESLDSILLAQKYGFENLTIDLMYGLPNQDLDVWEKQLDTALGLGVPHISSYCLTVESRTALQKFVRQGLLYIPHEDLITSQYDLLVNKLESNGFEHYEISNFGKPNFFAKHNSNYWLGHHYLGIGPSAHGFNGDNRYWNIANNAAYIKDLRTGKLPETIEKLTIENRFNELILIGLRTSWGVDSEQLESLIPFDLKYQNLLKKLSESGVVEWRNSHFRLSKIAKFQADYYASMLFL